MNGYKIQIIKSCQRFLDDLKEHNIVIHSQLCDTIKEIIPNPFNSKFKKLRNSNRDRRARSGDFRIVFFVSNNTIFILKCENTSTSVKSRMNRKFGCTYCKYLFKYLFS